jgi:phospholipase C
MKRRKFLGGVLGATGAAVLGPRAVRAGASLETSGLLPPQECGIEHIVVLMMENRSFDHLLGWLPNADGQQAGLSYLDEGGVAHPTHAMAPDFTGCGFADPDHSYNGGRAQRNGGAMDGFLEGTNDDFALGYYVEEDKPFLAALARNYTALDRSFCSILGPTFPNRIFMHSGQTDRLSNKIRLSRLPTIWDRLLAAGVSCRYYYSNLPVLALWGGKYREISRRYRTFLKDAAAGTLPQVSFVEPVFTLLDDGTGNDDHAHADVRRGDFFLAKTFRALAEGPKWSKTVFILTHDEWGGFFDHVPPPRAAAANDVDPDIEGGKTLLGFRIPTIIASPFSRGHADDPRVKHDVCDHTSTLKLIEWRFGVAPLTPRDASSDVANLASLLDFHHPQTSLPDLPSPVDPGRTPCPPGMAEEGTDVDSRNPFRALAESRLVQGWGQVR